jgi:uncharacterized membrane protein
MLLFPISVFLLLFIIILIPVLLILIPVRVVEAAFKRLGIPAPIALFLFLASLVGSLINIPIANGLVPHASTHTTLAINVGGAVIPVFICLLLLPRAPFFPTVVGTSISILVCYLLARPVPGIGITIPTLIPPLAAILCAFFFSPKNRAPVAYVSGVMGVLIGADLLHLTSLPPYNGVMSIGGAGVFDGIFLVGILAALFA